MSQRPKKKAEYVLTIGIDWADQKHDLWIHDTESSEAIHQCLPHTPEAIVAWVADLRTHIFHAS